MMKQVVALEVNFKENDLPGRREKFQGDPMFFYKL